MQTFNSNVCDGNSIPSWCKTFIFVTAVCTVGGGGGVGTGCGMVVTVITDRTTDAGLRTVFLILADDMICYIQ